MLPRTLFALTALLSLAAALVAQPSGGPYGPIQQTYELPAAKRIYYVAPDGLPDSPGRSLEQPTSLAAAISRVITGDAIILRGGIYRTGGLRVSQGVTLQPYADERPILKGTEVATDWQALPDNRWQTYWSRLFPAEPADWWNRFNIIRTPLHLFNNDMLFLDGRLLSAVGNLKDLTPDSYHIDYERGLVTIGTDPTDRTVEITAQNSALVRTIRPAHGKPNDQVGITLRGITFTQYARLALEIEGTEPSAYMPPENFGKEIIGSTLEHLTLSFCSRVAGYFRGDNLTIRHCLVSDCGTEGLYIINSADVLLERNIVTRTNSAEKFWGYYASSVKIFNQSYRTVCRENLIIDNPNASGIWYDVGNVDGLIVNNWFQNTRDGFFFEISKGAICAGNVFVDCTPGSRVLNSSNVQLYQNTYYNSQASFERSARSHTAGDHFGWHSSAGPDVEERHGHVFLNNLLAADSTFQGSLLNFRQTPDLVDRLTEPQVKTLDGNFYARQPTPSKEPLITLSPNPEKELSLELDSPEQIHALYPDFSDSSEALLNYSGPLFRGAELGNFDLSPDSPAIDSALPTPPVIKKLLHLPAKSATPGAYPAN